MKLLCGAGVRRVFHRVTLAHLILGMASCKHDVEKDGTLLVVKPAQEQPGRDELGIILAVQSWGGRWLELEVTGGLLWAGKTSACLPAPQAGHVSAITHVVVYPEQTEAVVTVRLLPDGERVTLAESDSGAAELGAGNPCRIIADPLWQVVKPVQRVNAVQPMAIAAEPNGVGGASASDAGNARNSGNGAPDSEGGASAGADAPIQHDQEAGSAQTGDGGNSGAGGQP